MAMYATASELRDQIEKSSTTSDDELEAILRAAGAAIDRLCNRPDGFLADVTASARYYTGSGLTYQWIDECTQVTAVAVKDSPGDDEDDYTAWVVGTVGTTTDADVFPASGDPRAPDFTNLPYTLLIVGANSEYSTFTSGQYTHKRGFRPMTTRVKGVPSVQVTARWGYADRVPFTIKEACIMQAARWYQRLKSSMADTIAGPEFGKLMYRKVLDPDIELLLVQGRYVRPAIGRRY